MLDKQSKNLKSRFRKNRLNTFLRIMNTGKDIRILDVGGAFHTWDEYPYRKNVTILNIHKPSLKDAEIRWIQGDARLLDFDNNSFDIVFSNSVIEHVGLKDSQVLMAKEIRRVGKGYWVQTPNKYFIIEIHFLFPFFHFLPQRVKRFVAIHWPFSFSKKLNLNPIDELEHLNSISYRQLKKLFPDCIILKEKFFGMNKSFIAYRQN